MEKQRSLFKTLFLLGLLKMKIVPDEEGIVDYEVLRFETTTPEGVDLVLWGDLRTMFDANAEDELCQNQERWNLKSWDFYKNYGVHTLILEDGTKIYMLAERKYPLIKETLEKMMSLKLVAESTSDSAYDLLRFIQKQIDNFRSYDGTLDIPEQMTTGKETSNPFMSSSSSKSRLKNSYVFGYILQVIKKLKLKKHEILQNDFDRLLEATLAIEVRNCIVHYVEQFENEKLRDEIEKISNDSKDV
ncbi:hypothetical protein Tco_0855749 [Tanacetum coccineum]